MTWLEGRNPDITELTRAAFLKYLEAARGAHHSHLAMRNQSGSTKAQAIDAEYQCSLRLIELAETALKDIEPQFRIVHIDKRDERRTAALAKRDEELRALKIQQETEVRSTRHYLSL